MSVGPEARFSQVAISVSDRERSLNFYAEVFGLTHVGGTSFSGKATEQVQGMAGASSTCSWLMDDRADFQFEIFEFDCPKGRPFAAARRPQDIGYSRLIFSVPLLEPIAERTGSRVLTLNGRQTLLLRDPDGTIVQAIKEPVPRARLTGVAASVPDLAIARRSFAEGCGCLIPSAPIPDWGGLWGECDADKEMLLLEGGNLTIEISKYRDFAPWPNGYRLADHGILNLALGFASTGDIRRRLAAMQAAGFVPNRPLVCAPGLFALTYANDPQGFSVETLHVTRLAAGAFGFRKANVFDRFLMAAMKAGAG